MSEARRGLAFGVTAYVLWGVFPLYFPLLEPAGAIEILAHRVFWSALTMGVIVVAARRTRQLRAIAGHPRTRALLCVAAVVVTVNWATYIWGVNNGRVVETSLGYFINPLVTVLMGIVVLGESLRRLQWVAMGVAAFAVVVLTVDYGRPPWVALVLACSFGTYGLAKKVAGVEAVESLTFETALLAPFAAAYLFFLGSQGSGTQSSGTFAGHGLDHSLLLMSAGVVTAVPLLCFGAAAVRIPMVQLGLLQYLAPIIQFALGVYWYDEAMPAGRWFGFLLVWLALAIFTFEALGHRRRQLRLAAEASAM